MAEQKKKTNTSGGKRAATNGKKSGGKKQAAPQPKPIRREVGGILCLLLAFFACFGYFNVEALFINFFCNGLKGLIGYGFWLVPPALLGAAIILLFHKGRPVRLRVTSVLLIPVLMGCLLHLFLVKVNPDWNVSMLKELWTGGVAVHSGGALSGVLSIAFVQVFSKVGSAVLFILSIWCLP